MTLPAATSKLEAAFILDAANAWAVGSSGLIMRFDGAAWTVQASGVTTNLNDVWFADASTGWAGRAMQESGWCSAYGCERLWETAGLGTMHAYSTSPDACVLMLMRLPAVGEGATLLKFSGGSWQAVDVTSLLAKGATDSLYDVKGSSATDVWVGADTNILRLVSGSWTNVPLVSINHAYTMMITPAGEVRSTAASQ